MTEPREITLGSNKNVIAVRYLDRPETLEISVWNADWVEAAAVDLGRDDITRLTEWLVRVLR
jgi:hypothetical protein